MLNIILALAVVLASVLPAKPQPPSCYIVRGARVSACICGRTAVPLWVCKAVNRDR